MNTKSSRYGRGQKMPKLKPNIESFTLLLEKDWRKIGEDFHEGPDKFNYSSLIRRAIWEYYKRQGYLPK